VLTVLDQTESECDIKLTNVSPCKLVDIHPPVFDVESEHVANENSLPHVLSLPIDSEDPARATPFGLKSIEARITTNIQDTLALQVLR